jgi:hypothetical protein
MTLVLQAVHQILLLEFQLFFFFVEVGAVNMSGKGKGLKREEREKFR